MKICKTETRYGKMTVLAADSVIGKSLVHYGEWTHSEISLLEQFIRPGMKVLDIGANIGCHTLAFSKAVGPTGRVVALEPQPFVFSLLAANLIENDVTNALALNMAIGRERGWVDMPDFTYNEPHNYGALKLDPFLTKENKQMKHIPVPVHRLDDLNVATSANVIKIDVEGMEAAVLEGARNLIQKSRPVLFVENELPGPGSQATLGLLLQMGYDAYWQTALLFEPENFRGNKENLFPNQGCMNVLAIPHELQAKVNGRKVTSASEHPRKKD